MTMPEPKPCTSCTSHCLFGALHLCTLPIEAFGLTLDAREPFDDDQAEWIGTDCDKLRRQGEICGPSGKLWEQRRT